MKINEWVEEGDKLKRVDLTMSKDEFVPEEDANELLKAIVKLHEKYGYHATCFCIANNLVAYVKTAVGSTHTTVENEHFTVEATIKKEDSKDG